MPGTLSLILSDYWLLIFILFASQCKTLSLMVILIIIYSTEDIVKLEDFLNPKVCDVTAATPQVSRYVCLVVNSTHIQYLGALRTGSRASDIVLWQFYDKKLYVIV